MNKATAVQRACIPPILQGQDVVACAETGGGKTAAYLLPALQMFAKERMGIFALVLMPARELAFQASESLRALGGAAMGVSDMVCVGGVGVAEQSRVLAGRPHFVFATPGRLVDILKHDANCAEGFKRLRYLVLDEADRLLDPQFEEDLASCLASLPSAESRQTLLFSATMTQSLVTMRGIMDEDQTFVYSQRAEEGGGPKIVDQYVFVPDKVREVYLFSLMQALDELKARSAIVFCRTCQGCHYLATLLDELDIPCVALHSKLTQRKRLASLQTFKSGVVPTMVATDVAGRGLDIPTVDIIINFDLPKVPREYVHRIGRTGRAGRRGHAISLVTQYNVKLLKAIEDLIGRQLTEYKCDEKAVLKHISRVFAARKAARLRIEEEQEAAQE